ncbi:hypothetical protein [Thiomonas sp.]
MPRLTINAQAGASWRLDDGYGPWTGDGESPLATAADYSAYDEAQTKLYQSNVRNLEKFNKSFKADLKAYSARYRDGILKMVNQNRAYQGVLLAYPQAVTKSYVIGYLVGRDLLFESAEHQWITSLNSVKTQLQASLGADLADIEAYNGQSSEDLYARKMNSRMVVAERDNLNAAWAPLESQPLKPLRAYEAQELTVAEAERMTWGEAPASTPPALNRAPARPGLRNPESGTPGETPQAPTAAVPSSSTGSLAQWLAFLLLAAGGGIWLWRRRRRRPGGSRPESETPDP